MAFPAGLIAVIFMVLKWGVPNIFLCKTFGKNVAKNWRLKLGLAQRSNQLGSTTNPMSIIKL
jgi:hypothetical protein